jgi:hypothetical protein
VETNDGEDEAQTQDEHNDGVNAQTGALIGVQLQHGARRATGTSGAGRGRAGIAKRFLVVGGGATAHGSTGPTGGSGRRRTADGRARGGSGTGGLRVRAGLGT